MYCVWCLFFQRTAALAQTSNMCGPSPAGNIRGGVRLCFSTLGRCLQMKGSMVL